MSPVQLSTHHPLSPKPVFPWLIAIWSLLLLLLLILIDHKHQSTIQQMALADASVQLNKDTALRLWASSHGRIYIPIGPQVQADPLLGHLSERDIVSPSGRELTLINPATILRQLNSQYGERFGYRSRVTSLQPLRPDNAPDNWERMALHRIEEGEVEVVGTDLIDGEAHLRLLRPIQASDACLGCHNSQGYSVGEVSGGMEVMVPLLPYQQRAAHALTTDLSLYGSFWLLCLGTLLTIGRSLKRGTLQRETAQRLQQTLYELAPDAMIILNHKTRVLSANQAAIALLHTKHDQLIDRPLFDTFVAETVDPLIEALEQSTSPTDGEAMPVGGSYTLQRITGGQFTARLRSLPIQQENSDLIALYLTETTAWQQESRQCELREERLELAIHGTREGLWDWHIDSGRLYLSDRWQAIVGTLPMPSPTINHWLALVHPSDIRAFQKALANHLAGRSDSIDCRHRLGDRDGVYRWMQCRGRAIRDAEGRAYRVTGLLTDIHDTVLHEEQLHSLSLRDVVTGLPTRTLFDSHLVRTLQLSQRQQQHHHALLFIALDHFQMLTDAQGRRAGEELLKGVASRVRHALRAGDILTRLEGGDFILLLEGITGDAVVALMVERLQQAIATPLLVDGEGLMVTASIGVALGDPRYRSGEQLVENARLAMSDSREKGAGSFRIFAGN